MMKATTADASTQTGDFDEDVGDNYNWMLTDEPAGSSAPPVLDLTATLPAFDLTANPALHETIVAKRAAAVLKRQQSNHRMQQVELQRRGVGTHAHGLDITPTLGAATVTSLPKPTLPIASPVEISKVCCWGGHRSRCRNQRCQWHHRSRK
jgi:hypothetical protein